jgi:arylsulfatase A-like enzyme
MLDTARADCFEPYGAPAGSTPVIADLARRGLAVQNVIAPSNWTLPSHAALFTGLLPGAIGLSSAPARPERGGMSSRPLLEAQRARTLAEVLRRRGYGTGAISANPWIHEVNGFSVGFDRFVSVRGRPPAPTGRGLRPTLDRWAEAWRARADDGAAEVAKVLESWLAEGSARPFFWFVNLMECHSPYLPPRPFNDLSPLQRIRAARDAERHLSLDGIYRYCVRRAEISAPALARMSHLYRRSVLLMDGWIGRLIESMERRGILDDTVVVVTADHGENLGENHLVSHMLSLDDRLLRVPLVVAGPARIEPPELVSLASLPRMLGDALGLAEHPWVEDLTADGVAVAEAAGEIIKPVAAELVRAWHVSDETVETMSRSMICATDGSFKLVRTDGRDELFDLATDGDESRPIDPASADGEVVARLRRAIDRAVERAKPETPPAAGDAPALSETEAAELEERMKLLGYM